MPNYEAALPPGAYNIKIVSSSGQEIPVNWYFTRDGKDGAEVIIPLFAGDEFIGKCLEGNWQKGNDGAIQGPFTVKINSGYLELTGRSETAGNDRRGWVIAKSKVPFLDDLVIDVHLKLPSHSSTDAFGFHFYLTENGSGDPRDQDNWIRCIIWTNTTTYSIGISKKINGTQTDLASSSITNSEGVFRIKFEENKPGHYHTHFYFHDGAGSVDETTDEVSGSPFSLNLLIESGFPAYRFDSAETTSRTVSSDFVRVTYPDLKIKYDLDDADISKGDVKVWDTLGSSNESDWQRVFDPDHQFVGDCMIENGLIRVWCQPTSTSLCLWDGTSFVDRTGVLEGFETINGVRTAYGWILDKIETLSPEKVTFRLKHVVEGSTHRLECTVRRGSYLIEIEPNRLVEDFIFYETSFMGRFLYNPYDGLRDAVFRSGHWSEGDLYPY